MSTVLDANTLVQCVAMDNTPDFIDIYNAHGGGTYKPPFLGHRGWMLYGDAQPLDLGGLGALAVCFNHNMFQIDAALSAATPFAAGQQQQSAVLLGTPPPPQTPPPYPGPDVDY